MSNQNGFVAGTLVHTDQGLVPIQELKIGDRVLSRAENDPDAPNEYKCVTKVMSFEDSTIIQLPYLQESSPELINIIYLSDCNLVWLEENKRWVTAIDLVTSNKLTVINNEDSTYVWKPSEVTKLISKNGEIYGYCNGIIEDLKYGNSLLKFENGELFTCNVDDIRHSEDKYIDNLKKIELKNNNNMDEKGFEVARIGQTKFRIPVHNLEVDDFQTYFVGELGVWVHQ